MPFSNPILAGTELIRTAIKSPNFEHGVSGWSINRDGTAEFESLATRGSIISNSDAPGEEGYETGMVNGVIYTEKINDPLDHSRITIQAGVITMMSPDMFEFGHLRTDNTGRATLDGDTGVQIVADSTGLGVRVPTDGYLRTLDNGTIKTWQAVPTLQSLWVADTTPPEYKIMPDGTVRFRGWIRNGTTAAGTLLFTMPAGARPLTNTYFIVAKPNNDTIYATLLVAASGAVTIRFIGTTATASLSLDHINYSVI